MRTNVILSILSAGVLFFALHISLWRFKPSNSPRVFLIIALGTLCVAAAGVEFAIVHGFQFPELFTILAACLFLFNAYFMVYNVLVRSVSVTILIGLRSREHSREDFGALLKDYLSSPRFDERVQVMHDSGLVNISGNRVALTAKGKVLARAAESMARLFSIGLEG